MNAVTEFEASSRSTVIDAARTALEQAGGDILRARDIMSEVARNDAVLREKLCAPWIERAAYEALRGVQRHVRRNSWAGCEKELTKDGQERVEAMAAINMASLLQFPLPGGRSLKDATGAEVGAAAQFYLRQSRDMGVKGRWLAAVAIMIPPKKTVGDVLDESKLKEMQKRAYDTK